VKIMRPRQLLPMFILFALVACAPYGVYYPYENYYGYQYPSPYYFYPYYSNPYGYYYYPHLQRHIERQEHKGFEHRGPSRGRGDQGRGGRH
jgi:hypothetical protein